jgi:transcriptional regulator with XRE-family HTH domain
MWNDTVRLERRARGLSQARLAALASLSPDAVASYELGRRRPSRDNLSRIVDALGLDDEAAARLLVSAGLDPAPTGKLRVIAARRVPHAELRAELASYPWPCLVLNEHFEVVGWNQAANTQAELDFGSELRDQSARNLLRMACSPHFRRRLVNWDEVMSIMVGMYKYDMMDVLQPENGSPYFNTLVNQLLTEAPEIFPHLIELWQNAPPWPDGTRITFQAHWQAGDGTALTFNCQTGAWSDFDAASAFDWHPADPATCEWMASRMPLRWEAPGPTGASRVEENEPRPGLADVAWNELLRGAREGCGLTRSELAARAEAVTEATIYSYETGRRHPSRESLLALTRGMELDGATTNLILVAAGMEPEPSDWSLFLSGLPVRASEKRYRRRVSHRSWPEIQGEIAAHPWPCLVVNGHCEVVCANPAVQLITGIDLNERRGPRRNLVSLITGATFRQNVENWGEVATAVLPGSLTPYFLGEGNGAAASYFHRLVEDIRGRDAAVLHTLLGLWRAAPRRRLTARVTFPLTWRAETGTLHFDCTLAPWNEYDPGWAIDWHPADAATWRHLERMAPTAAPA